MNRLEYDATVTIEELGEVITECLAVQKVLTKTLRFGPDDPYYNEALTKAEKLREELLDLRICVQVLEERGLIAPITESDVRLYRELKQLKIAATREHARRAGTLTD